MEESDAANTQHSKQKKLSFAQLSMVIFTLTCAGPYGIEEAVQSGGVLYTLIGLMVLPFIYSIPQSLMCAELGSMMPSHHGYIVWVFRGFEHDKLGHFFGFYNAVGCIVGMAKEYLLCVFLIVIGALFNIANITTLGNSAILFAVIILLPFFIGFFYALPQTNVSAWFDTTPQNEEQQYQFGLFLATMVWLHTGCLSAEIGFKKSNFFAAFVVAMLLDYIGYTLPVLGALTVPCKDTDTCWDDGYLYTAYHQILPGLGWAVAVSGFVSNYAIYVAEMSVQARAFWALSQPFVLLTQNGKMYIESGDGLFYDDNMDIVGNIESRDGLFYGGNIDTEAMRRIRIGMLPQWLCGTIWDRTGAPVRGVILQSVICCGLVAFDFELLLQASVLINAITWVVELCSFLRLRYTEPNTPRPYKVPGGMFVAWLITMVKCILVVTLFVLVIRDHPYYIFLTFGFLIFTIVYYLLYRKYNEKRYKHEKALTYEMIEARTCDNSPSKSSQGKPEAT